MKKGISIWSFDTGVTFGTGNLDNVFALAKKAGFDGVELALAEVGDINLNTTKEDMEKIKALADKHGIELYSIASGLYWDYPLTSNDPAVVEKAKSIVKKQLELASYIGADTILVVPGLVDPATPYDVAYERAFNALKELAPVAEQYGVVIGVENVWNKMLVSPMEMADFVDKIGSKYVGCYFDVGNVVLFSYPEHWIKVLGNRIKKVHFKDFKASVGTLDGFVDILAGDVNYPAVMDAFKAVGYDNWVTAEMLPPYTHYPETIVYNTSNAMDKILGR